MTNKSEKEWENVGTIDCEEGKVYPARKPGTTSSSLGKQSGRASWTIDLTLYFFPRMEYLVVLSLLSPGAARVPHRTRAVLAGYVRMGGAGRSQKLGREGALSARMCVPRTAHG